MTLGSLSNTKIKLRCTKTKYNPEMVGEVAMSKRRIDWVISMVGVLLLGMALVQGQQAPDMIVFKAMGVPVSDIGCES